jgi:hypothetical protein
VLNAVATETPTRLPRFVGALLVAALAFPFFARPVQVPIAVREQPTRCGALLSENRPRAVIRTRTHVLNPRFMTRRLCGRDSAGRIHCAR